MKGWIIMIIIKKFWLFVIIARLLLMKNLTPKSCLLHVKNCLVLIISFFCCPLPLPFFSSLIVGLFILLYCFLLTLSSLSQLNVFYPCIPFSSFISFFIPHFSFGYCFLIPLWPFVFWLLIICFPIPFSSY